MLAFVCNGVDIKTLRVNLFSQYCFHFVKENKINENYKNTCCNGNTAANKTVTESVYWRVKHGTPLSHPQLWGTTSNSNIEILERFQSKVLRLIVDAPWYVSNSVISNGL
jgi:hypothetical protein